MTVVVTVPTTYTATGHGTDPLGFDVTFPFDQEEQDSVTVEVSDSEAAISIDKSPDKQTLDLVLMPTSPSP